MAAENFKVKKGLEVGTGATITSEGVNVTGIITATQFKGDGSGLTGVVGSGSGIIIKDEGSAVGTAGTVNFVGSGVTSTLSEGTATITISSGGLTDVVDDTTPQLGGNLDLNSKFITGSGNIDITGSLDVSGISTTGFLEVGNLTNGRVPYVGSASGRLVDSSNLTFDGSNLFVSGINVTSAGTTSTFGADIVTRNLNVTGVSTFGGVVNISDIKLQSSSNQDLIQTTGTSGLILENTNSITVKQRSHPNWEYAKFTSSAVTLKYQNQTKLTTTSSGITVPDLEATGTGTFGQIETDGVTLGTNNNTFAAKFIDDAVANFGTDNDMQVLHTGSNGNINNYTGDLIIRTLGSGDDVLIDSEDDILLRTNSTFNSISCVGGEGVELYHYSGSGVTSTKRIETTKHGAIVTGVCTATSFSGSAAGLTNIPSAQLSGALPSLDGSALTGITASGTGIIVQHDGSNVGTAGTINFSTNLDVSPISAGIVTVTASGGSSTQDKIEEGNSTAEVIGSGTNDGEFLVKLQDATASGAGVTAFKLYQSSSSTTSLELFKENKSQNAYLDINNAYTSNASIRINFKSTGFANRTGTIYYSPVTESFEIRDNAGASMLSINSGISGSAGSVVTSKLFLPNSDNALGCGTSTRRWSELHAVNVQAGIVTATTFSGSGASLTTLNADELDSGTIPNGRFPATLPTVSGANLTNLPVPTQITVADESSDQTCNILFTTAATGDLAPKSSSALTYDSNGEVLRATLFSGSGASLTNLNASNIGSGTMSASRLTGALPAISGASLTNLPAPTPATSDIQVVYEITNQSSFSYFRFAGNGVDSSANNPDIYLTRGQKYRFINNSGGAHPFQIQTTGGSAYTTGVTYPSGTSATSGNIDFAIRWDAPSQLKYVCLSHGSMVGNIYIDGGDEGRSTTSAATGSIAQTAYADITIPTTGKTFALLKIAISAPAWVVLYTDASSRTSDAAGTGSGRSEGTDPTPGSGVLAEVSTTTSGASTFKMTPGLIGWNDDGTPAAQVYARVYNKRATSGSNAITVTLTSVNMEI